MSVLYVGMVAPYQYVADLVPGDSGLDLSTVTAATIEIRKPDGTTVSWAATRSNQTTSTLTLTHNLAAGTSEIDQAGEWHFYAELTVAGGFRRTEHWVEDVRKEHG